MIKLGDYLHFRRGMCCFRGAYGKMIRPQRPHKRRIHLRKARISTTAWGLLRQYIKGRLGWIMHLHRTLPHEVKLVFTEHERIPHDYDTSKRPLVLMYDQEEQKAMNPSGIKIILWCLTTVFGTGFETTKKGQCVIFSPIMGQQTST